MSMLERKKGEPGIEDDYLELDREKLEKFFERLFNKCSCGMEREWLYNAILGCLAKVKGV